MEIHIKKKYFLLLSGLCFALLFFSKCKSDTRIGAPDQEMLDSTRAYNPATDTSLTPEVAVMDWNAAMNDKFVKGLERMYADEIELYGRRLTRTEAIAIKIEFFRQNPDYTQFLSDIEIDDFTPEAVRAKFRKQTVIKNNTKLFYSYLIMERGKRGWEIIAEGDSASTNVVTSKEYTEIKKKEIKTCEAAAEAIFLSSATVQKLLGERYVRYKLEYMPGAKDNPNNRFWFWVFAAPPNADMTQTYGRFQVDPKNGQLYEYKAVEDSAVPIDYDKELKKQLSKYCGKL
jgi:hypothetical protein